MAPEASTVGGDQSVEELRRELAEACEQRAATAGILAAISNSPTDAHQVFAEIAASAARVCDAYDATIYRVDGDVLRLVAHHGPIPVGPIGQFTLPLTRGILNGRAILDRRMIQVDDLQSGGHEYPAGRDFAVRFGSRTQLSVPLIRASHAIGVICIRRTEVRPFGDRQIDLLKTFADQAVNAIENARLFEAEQTRTKELRESLEYQKAISDVLEVISRSPSNLQPIMEVIAENAARVCGPCHASVLRADGRVLWPTASAGVLKDVILKGPTARRDGVAITRGTVSGRAFLDRRTIHVEDLAAELDQYPDARAHQKESGHHTTLATPLVRDDTPLGVILIRRNEVKPFTDKEIKLLETFANQAVIAIENARLFQAEQMRARELQESLEYQTATSNVLGVISRSPNELQPVLDAIAETAKRLCPAERAAIWRFGDDGFKLSAHTGISAEVVRFLQENPIPTGRASLAGRSVLERRTIHFADVMADPDLGTQAQSVFESLRTMLTVPLLREGQPIGVISLGRREVSPFTDKQIDLVTTFADQAVIAIENARLFGEVEARTRELTESLEQQTATSEVLGVISSSQGELKPVFQTILENATRICEAKFALLHHYENNAFRIVALHNLPPAFAEERRRNPILGFNPGTALGRMAATKQTVQIADAQAEPAYHSDQIRSALLSLGGARTVAAVPMLKEDELVGAIVIYRQEVRPFTDKQIALVTSFARQAVIAIENARLLDELQARTRELTESVLQQTATADVLKVISRSAFDVKVVLDTLVRSTAQLCGADMVSVTRPAGSGDTHHHVASFGFSPEWFEYMKTYPLKPERGTLIGRTLLERRTIHIPDVLADANYTATKAQQLGEHRAVLGVPLLRDGAAIGVFMIARRTPRPFTENQIELVETFADQAVIAIENTRLFEEVQARTTELAQSVDELRALGDVSQAVNSTINLEVVLSTIVAKAVQISGTEAGTIYVFDEASQEFRLRASYGMDDTLIAAVKDQPVHLGETSVISQAAMQRTPVQLPDVQHESSSLVLDVILRAGFRALLTVPLLSAERIVGALVVRRKNPGEFPKNTVDLLQTFGAQSVLAIQNARLFEEIAQKGRELEIASQHKSQFVANMSHELRTPLAAILGYAELMQEGFYGAPSEKSMEALTRIRSNGKHLLGLINTVLDIAKIESGQFSLNLGEYAIDSVVETVCVATESLAATKKLALKAEVATRLPIGVGDEQRLTQVLLNLVGNAIKFTDIGEVRITASAANGHFTVGVTDTGPGIPPDELKRVFEQFHQVDNSNTKAKGGTGLGLAISKQIVEMHGGRIWVESTVGKGSTFQMELPVRAEAIKGAA